MPAADGNVLVAYYSAQGHTAVVAQAIADELGVHASTVGRWFAPPVEEPETTTEMETTS